MKKEEIQKVIDKFEDFKRNDVYPDCAVCTIRWKDTKEEEGDCIISFHDVIGTPMDEIVFFSCSGFYNGFLHLLDDDNGEIFFKVQYPALINVLFPQGFFFKFHLIRP